MQKDKLILVAHYDPAGRLTPDWCTLLRLLQQDAFADLRLVSTGLDPATLPDDLRNMRIDIRENVGYDFYSWRQALLDSPLELYRQTILVNNSFHVVDPEKFRLLLRTPVEAGRHFRGLTVSWQKRFHAQSYYLELSREVTQSASFRAFWHGMLPISEREAVIDSYELGLSRALGAEFPIASIMPLSDYDKFLLLRRVLKDPSVVNADNLDHAYEQLKVHFNPSILLWESLLYRYGIVKKQVVHENPFKFPVDDLRRFIAFRFA